MARLTTLRPTIGTLRPSVAYMPEGERERDRLRASTALRQLYNSPRWRKLRREIMKRDHYVCQKTGVLLTGKAPAPNSPVVDHKRPHRGDEALFFDPTNLWTVSKAWHDSEKQRLDKRVR